MTRAQKIPRNLYTHTNYSVFLQVLFSIYISNWCFNLLHVQISYPHLCPLHNAPKLLFNLIYASAFSLPWARKTRGLSASQKRQSQPPGLSQRKCLVTIVSNDSPAVRPPLHFLGSLLPLTKYVKPLKALTNLFFLNHTVKVKKAI